MRNSLPQTVVRPLPKHLQAQAEFAQSEFNEDQDTTEVQLREFLRILSKYRMVLIAGCVLGVILSLIYAFTATPRYTAESTVRIGTYQPVLTSTRVEDLLEEKSKEANYLETQTQEMRSYSLADLVLQEPRIYKSFETRNDEGGILGHLFGSSQRPSVASDAADRVAEYKSPIGLIKSYLDQIQIKPIRRTSLVTVEATANSPETAALMANRHALSYIDWVRKNRVEQQSRGLTFLRAQADELREKVSDLEREMADYAESNSIVAVNKDENITAQKMAQLNQLFTQATAKRIEAEKTYDEAEKSLQNPSAGFDDATIQTMRSDLARAESEYQQLSTKFTANYPRMQQLNAQIQGLRRSLENQRKQVVAGLKGKMLSAREEEKNLKEELEQQKSAAYELSKRQVQYNVLNRESTSSRELLENVLKQIKETSLAVESNASNVSIVDYAPVPRFPTYPQKKLIIFFGFVLGAGLGLALAILLNYMDNSVRTPEDVQHYLQLPNLGVVPSFDLGLPDGQSIGATAGSSRSSVSNGRELIAKPGSANLPPIVFVNDPRSLAAEAYRTIRTGILLSQAGEPPRTILVSSAQSSEGKTTSSINLAASLASAGGRVVIIDADLRRPSLHKHFRMPSDEPGLVEVITGQLSIKDVALPDVIKRVTLIKSGRIPPNPAELLGSLEMATIIDQLSANYDYVIIDSPPILPVTDSVILSRYVDGVVLVVKGGATPRKVVLDARRRLQTVGARMLGVLLNDVDITGGDYYYYQRYYHSYYQSDRDQGTERQTASAARRRKPTAANAENSGRS